MAIDFTKLTSAKVIAHWMPWFGSSSHISLNYNTYLEESLPYDERNPAILEDQVECMHKRGIFAVNPDYYGPESFENLTSLKMLSTCETGGLAFFLCIDKGALHALTGDAATKEYQRIFEFIRNAFFPNPAYWKIDGKPVVNFFDEAPGADWSAIGEHELLIFQNSGGFTHARSAGAFGWVHPTTPASNWNNPAIQTFINGAKANPSKIAMYPIYPGFDDSAALWGSNRFMSRRAGMTLRDTLQMIPSGAQYAMLATWNDHEEGSGIEEAASMPM